MARPLRLQGENCFYHITNRGAERKKIFISERDYAKFLEYCGNAIDTYRCYVHAYCLMSNHYHLIIETSRANLSQVMQYVNGAYTVYFNRQRKKCGHVFQGRYKSLLIEKESYFLELTRYIHLNPVRAKIVDKPEGYRWSSYTAYVDKEQPSIIDREKVSGYLGLNGAEYRRFVLDGLGEGNNPLKQARGGMILGSKEFIEDQIKKLESMRSKYNVSNRRQLMRDIEPAEILKVISQETGKEVGELQKRSRGQRLRKIAIYVLRRTTAQSNEQIGAVFGIGNSAVSKVVREVEELRGNDKEVGELICKIIDYFKA
ncbi:MAG: transposase [Candidatus Omnitrophica bacterium]|nr:transposase [Candidatus Omnitrophota bacterium]